MTEQDPHGFSGPAKPNAPTPIIHKPDSRADVDRKKTATIPQPERKFLDNEKVQRMNDQDILEYHVYIVSARYDEEEKEWMYKVTDWERKALPGETKETRLG